jgi:hypothetical protein
MAMCLSTPASVDAAQNQAPAANAAASKPTPRTAEGHPDLNGFWFTGSAGPGLAFYGKEGFEVGEDAGLTVKAPDGSIFYNHISAGSVGITPTNTSAPGMMSGGNIPPYKPEYLEKVKASAGQSLGNINVHDPILQCKPMGVPRANSEGQTGGVHVVHSRDYVAILYEDAPAPYWRLIYTDGREHPKNVDTSYFGHSIGRWEGDTLVVDTVALNDETMLDESARGGPYRGMLWIHSDQLHVVERWTRKGDEILYQATVEDPVMFTKPWVITPRTTRLAAKGDFIRPQMCDAKDAESIEKILSQNPGSVF